MIIKKLLNDIEINKYTVLLVFIALITGLIKEIIVIFMLLFIHEIGHYSATKYYKWNIKKITFYPFGGLITFEDQIDKPLKEELLITLMGPIFQIIIYMICYHLYNNYYINEYMFSLIKNYHYGILLFNLLPIIPLDGSKILNILLNRFLNFRKSYIVTIYSSLIVLIISIYNVFNDTSYYILICFLLYQVFINIKNKNYIYNKFILEKKLYPKQYNQYKKVNNYKKMYRNKKHLFLYNNTYITEKQMFNKRNK